MATTIISLFEKADGTLDAILNLGSQPFPHGSIGIIANRRGTSIEALVPLIQPAMGSGAGMVLVIFLTPADLAAALNEIRLLDEIDLPEEEIQTYVEAVQRGEVLASVEVDEPRFDQVWEIMGRRVRRRSVLRGRPFLAYLASPHGSGKGY